MKWKPDQELHFDSRDLSIMSQCSELWKNSPKGTNPYVFLLRFVTYALSIDPNDPDLQNVRHTLLKKLREEGLSPFKDDPEEAWIKEELSDDF